MASHKLSLDIPDTLNDCVLRIVDMSVYIDEIPVTCPQLQIATPGFSNSYMIDNVPQDFAVNLTACDLGVQSELCGKEYNALPDGIYVIKWSVSPNEVIYVEYNHLRMTQALLRIKGLLCDLDLSTCAPSAQVKASMDKLTEIRQFLDAAKAKVENCRQAKQGWALYKYAVSLLDKMDCKLCN